MPWKSINEWTPTLEFVFLIELYTDTETFECPEYDLFVNVPYAVLIVITAYSDTCAS